MQITKSATHTRTKNPVQPTKNTPKSWGVKALNKHIFLVSLLTVYPVWSIPYMTITRNLGLECLTWRYDYYVQTCLTVLISFKRTSKQCTIDIKLKSLCSLRSGLFTQRENLKLEKSLFWFRMETQKKGFFSEISHTGIFV